MSDALAQELAEMREGLSGELRFGVIPAAMPVAPLVTNPFCAQNPRVTLRLLSARRSRSSAASTRARLEAGLTYLDNEPLGHVRVIPLYREHYCC